MPGDVCFRGAGGWAVCLGVLGTDLLKLFIFFLFNFFLLGSIWLGSGFGMGSGHYNIFVSFSPLDYGFRHTLSQSHSTFSLSHRDHKGLAYNPGT